MRVVALYLNGEGMNSVFVKCILYASLLIFGGSTLYHLVFHFIKNRAKKNKQIIPVLLSKYIYYPGQFAVFIITCWIALEIIRKLIPIAHYQGIRHIFLIALTVSLAFLLIRAITVLRETTLHHYTLEEPVDYSLRKAKTKFQLMQRVFNFLIILITCSIILMTFKSIREIGTTLLASAGVLGIVIGFAAQKSLGTLFAGLQIAISQPIRIDDIVVVEEQFGTIGEITLTYVVINCWDGRRLIVPISYFLEKPFENWTRISPEVVSKIKIYADYTLPVEKLRDQVKAWLEASPLWDKRTWGVLVTSAGEKTIEVRATMSAKDSSDAFDLECLIREKMISYIRDNYPRSLPQTRIQSIPDLQP